MRLSRLTRRLVVGGLVAGVLGVLTAAPAYAIGAYSIGVQTGKSYQIQTNQSQNLVSGTVDDQVFKLSVDTPSGIRHLQFQPKLFGTSFRSFFVSSNGNLQFGGDASLMTTQFSNDCLPSSAFQRPTLMPLWDDLFFYSNDTSHFFREGVFVKKGGTSPNRFVMISWQGHHFGDSGSLVLVQVRLNEGSNNPIVTYGATEGSSATVGVQSANGASAASFTQFSCNPGTNNLAAGERLNFFYTP